MFGSESGGGGGRAGGAGETHNVSCLVVQPSVKLLGGNPLAAEGNWCAASGDTAPISGLVAVDLRRPPIWMPHRPSGSGGKGKSVRPSVCWCIR